MKNLINNIVSLFTSDNSTQKSVEPAIYEYVNKGRNKEDANFIFYKNGKEHSFSLVD